MRNRQGRGGHVYKPKGIGLLGRAPPVIILLKQMGVTLGEGTTALISLGKTPI